MIVTIATLQCKTGISLYKSPNKRKIFFQISTVLTRLAVDKKTSLKSNCQFNHPYKLRCPGDLNSGIDFTHVGHIGFRFVN